MKFFQINNMTSDQNNFQVEAENGVINTKDFIKFMSNHPLIKNQKNVNSEIAEATRMFNVFKDVFVDCLKRRDVLRLQKLFTAQVKITEARTGTNPKNREPILVKSNAKISIKISDALKKQIMDANI